MRDVTTKWAADDATGDLIHNFNSYIMHIQIHIEKTTRGKYSLNLCKSQKKKTQQYEYV